MPAATSSPEPSFTYAPGDIIAGKYALEEQLGEGGMGAVFRARNTTIDMPVAIKLIRADLDRAQLTGRLLQEARAAAKLSHPAIVRVFDVGQTALGDPFIVMELLHGESLSTVIERDGRLPPTRAVQLLLPIADGLAVAHAKGFVHRDVKPDNVFIALDEEGQLQPKLVDFGIVKQVAQSGDSQLTQVGSVVGSPEYMSPEQARGLDHIDARSDVWSFSILLYEALSGTVPFESSNYNALLRLIVESEPVDLRELAAADEALAAIVLRGLAKDPEARWPSMTELGKALAVWLTEQGIHCDACGVSLQTRWISRASDPAALGRASRSSSPDGWPEPPSGVRAVETWRERMARSTPPRSPSFASAPTVHAARQATTPPPTQDAQPSAPRAKLPSHLVLGGLSALIALTVTGWLLTRSHSDARESANPSAAAPVLPAVPERPRSAVELPAPVAETTVTSPEAASLPAAASPSVAKPKPPAKPVGNEPSPAAVEPETKPVPEPPKSKAGDTSDLIAPY